MKVDENYVRMKIEELSCIGRDDKGVLSRLAYSPSFWKSVHWLEKLMKEAGLTVTIDGVGNVIGSMPGEEGYGDIILGSHIDTVLNAGSFDGAVGVIAAVETARALRREKKRLRHPLKIIAFAEEEGLVISGLFGSRAYIGKIEAYSQDSQIASEIGIDFNQIRNSATDVSKIQCYLELHIEQGGVLEKNEKDIGIVTAIVGYERYKITIHGKENHAGTTPMEFRDDALVKAAKMILDLPQKAVEIDKEMVCTVGVIKAYPGACNTVPGKVIMEVDMRAVEESSIEKLRKYMYSYYCEKDMEIQQELSEPPARMNKKIQEKIEAACKKQGYSYHYMPSGAAHDTTAMSLVTSCGMIFIPSIGGISHSPKECTAYEDVNKGTQILMDTLLLLDELRQ